MELKSGQTNEGYTLVQKGVTDTNKPKYSLVLDKKPENVTKGIDVKRILKNELTILLARSDEGKTTTLIDLIKGYQARYLRDIRVYGMDTRITDYLNVKPFNSLIELEQIRNSIIVIDEVGFLFELENRKKRRQIDNILRKVNHNGNKIVMSGVPSDFKQFLCAKTKCFMFKGLNISELINGSLAKEVLLQYRGEGVGEYSFDIDKDKVLCYDGEYFIEDVEYNPETDIKKENKDMFEER